VVGEFAIGVEGGVRRVTAGRRLVLRIVRRWIAGAGSVRCTIRSRRAAGLVRFGGFRVGNRLRGRSLRPSAAAPDRGRQEHHSLAQFVRIVDHMLGPDVGAQVFVILLGELSTLQKPQVYLGVPCAREVTAPQSTIVRHLEHIGAIPHGQDQKAHLVDGDRRCRHRPRAVGNLRAAVLGAQHDRAFDLFRGYRLIIITLALEPGAFSILPTRGLHQDHRAAGDPTKR